MAGGVYFGAAGGYGGGQGAGPNGPFGYGAGGGGAGIAGGVFVRSGAAFLADDVFLDNAAVGGPGGASEATGSGYRGSRRTELQKQFIAFSGLMGAVGWVELGRAPSTSGELTVNGCAGHLCDTNVMAWQKRVVGACAGVMGFAAANDQRRGLPRGRGAQRTARPTWSGAHRLMVARDKPVCL